MWHFYTVTFRLYDNFLLRHFDHVTFCYCDIPTLWQFSTVTLRPCDILLLWHSDSVTIFYCDIPTQSGRIVHPPQKVDVFSHCDIPTHCYFGQPMAVTFVHFEFPFLPLIPCPSCRRFWQMMISWHYPFNFWTSTHWFGRLRLGRGYAKGVFFWLFFRSDRSVWKLGWLLAVFPTVFWPLWHFVHPLWNKPEGFQVVPVDLWQNVHISLKSKSGRPVTIQVKKGGRPITVTKRPTFRGGGR